MTRKYVAIPKKPPRADWCDDYSLVPDLTVYEPDDTPEDTGLVDKRGTPIMAYTERRKIGFHSLG